LLFKDRFKPDLTRTKTAKAFEIVADNVHFADSKRDTSAPAMGGGMYQQPTARPEVTSAPAPAYTSGDTGDFEEILNDDDLPF